MFVDFLVRLTIGTLAILGFQLSALYFLPMVVLLNTHHKEFLGGSSVVVLETKKRSHWAPFLFG
ncbi:hypothetical protein [Vibrio sp. 624788]|uniref:hypothetical protein n=1 Tax=Vibrio sp. 624788 TaxID=1234362 RepID=UPI0003131E02|nr:hypothetical protein [Vibrio sp. 624788]